MQEACALSEIQDEMARRDMAISSAWITEFILLFVIGDS